MYFTLDTKMTPGFGTLSGMCRNSSRRKWQPARRNAPNKQLKHKLLLLFQNGKKVHAQTMGHIYKSSVFMFFLKKNMAVVVILDPGPPSEEDMADPSPSRLALEKLKETVNKLPKRRQHLPGHPG